jgi:DNA modification methylase
MRDNGWLGGPVVTDTDGLIADGEHRWRAAQEIGLSEVPVRQFDIDDAERRLWRQELNKIHGEHDTKRDALEYDYLLDNGKSDEVHALTDAADEDLDELLAEIKTDSSMPPAYEYDPEHNVYFEDCVEGMRERLDDDSVDCVITDPPYGVDANLGNSVNMSKSDKSVDHNFGRETVENDDLEGALDTFEKTAVELSRVVSPDGHAYVFGGFQTYHHFARILERHGFHVQNCLVWVKKDSSPVSAWRDARARYAYKHEFVLFAVRDEASRLYVDGNPDDILEYATARFADVNEQATVHPTQKPVSLISELVTNSTREGDTILDPFMGSGTTAVAAIQNDREYVGFEVDADNYRDVIERRIGEAKRQRDASVNTE